MLYREFLQASSRFPDHSAISFGGFDTSFRALKTMAEKAGGFFLDAGLKKGDRVLVLLDNGPEYSAVFFGILAAGGVAVPMNPTNTPENIRYVAIHCEARFAVVNERAYPLLANWWDGRTVVQNGPGAPGVDILQTILEEGMNSKGSDRQEDDSDLALVLYTSGTTGKPKGVMLSHRNLVANTRSIQKYLLLAPSDRTLTILPFYYSYGNSLLLTHAFAGATLVIENGFAYLNQALRVMREQKVTGISGVPSHFAMLLGRSRFLDEEWPNLRYMTCAGGPLPNAHIERIRKSLPHVRLHVMYGQTEGAARLSSLDPSLIDRKRGSIGRGIPDVELRVVRKDGREVEQGEIGEIIARGENIMMGYWNDPEGTAEAIRDGWLHTGDLANVDQEGFVYIQGREKEFIKSGGYRIGPQQVEDVITRHPFVEECAVAGEPDEILGERVVAYIRPKGQVEIHGLDREILDFSRENLPAYMAPSKIRFVSSLPKTDSGKVKRRSLSPHPACLQTKTVRGTLVHGFLQEAAERYPDKIALMTRKGRWSYRQLEDDSNALARALISRGLLRGDRVAILHGNSRETVVSIFAALKAGGAFVVINPATKPDKLEFILSNSGARALVTSTSHMPVDRLAAIPERCGTENIFASGLEKGQGPIISLEDAIRSGRDDSQLPKVLDKDLAALVYTSGSTGVPKGVAVTHHNVVSASSSINAYLQNGPEDIVLNVLPLSFDYGLYQIFLMFQAGGKVILEESFPYVYSVLRILREQSVTGFPCVSTIFAMLARLKDYKGERLPNLRYITNTGSAVSPVVVRRIREMFPSVSLFLMYGLTECKRVSYLPPEELERRIGSVGKAMPNVDAYVVREDGSRAGPGETGELVVRGSNVMQGYWRDQAATDSILRPGPTPWEKVLYTGDLFRSDNDGFLYFVSRKDDIIKCRGEKVSPKEVENLVLAFPGVLEAVAVGIEDEILGQTLALHVVPERHGTINEEQIRLRCTETLETNQLPKHIILHASLPRNSSGKIDREALRKYLPDRGTWSGIS